MATVAARAPKRELAPHWRDALRESVRRVNAGDPRLLFATYARDVRFVFPGDSSWGGDYRGREAAEPQSEKREAGNRDLRESGRHSPPQPGSDWSPR